MSNNARLTSEEQDILQAYGQGEYRSVLTPEMRQHDADAAQNASKTDKRVSNRISGRDPKFFVGRDS